MGAASKRTPEVESEILERLSAGEPLASICRSDEKFPHPTTWNDWCAADESLSIAHRRARETGYDAIAAQCLDIADDKSQDTIDTDDGPLPNKEWMMRSKLRVETRLKLLAKWDPKRYGDRIAQEISGPDGGPIQQAPAMTDEKMDALAEKIAAARARRDA